MAQDIFGTGRVTVFSLIHTWPDLRAAVAYATTGHFGDTAVLGVIPVPNNVHEPGDLFAIAGKHEPTKLYGQPHNHATAAWLACTGFSSRLTPKPNTIDLDNVSWRLDMVTKRTMDKNLYGHEHVAAGRLTFGEGSGDGFVVDEALMTRAQDVLLSPAAATTARQLANVSSSQE
ncbi:hypothetical protein ABT160_04440 [Streptomyces sp. NPDC001941]|uniref:hypothetical protein n=1 Tax=Streptomyces sp. NPDC001941 TaxID=3154659 RepID=UPI0033329926